MFGRTRPAVGLAWGPGLSEVLGGSNAGVTAACPWGGGGTWGTGTPAMGGEQGRQRRWAGRGPKAPLRVGETVAGSRMSWRATVAAPPDGLAVPYDQSRFRDPIIPRVPDFADVFSLYSPLALNLDGFLPADCIDKC